jgi:hypothetical protein
MDWNIWYVVALCIAFLLGALIGWGYGVMVTASDWTRQWNKRTRELHDQAAKEQARVVARIYREAAQLGHGAYQVEPTTGVVDFKWKGSA